jgi:hypothetical protein
MPTMAIWSVDFEMPAVCSMPTGPSRKRDARPARRRRRDQVRAGTSARTVDRWKSNQVPRDRRSNLRRRMTASAGFGRRHVISPYQLITGLCTDAGNG